MISFAAAKRNRPRPVTVDFETLPIQDRPCYPPPAVGVSIKLPGKPSRHYGWGYTEGNNCTWPEAKAALEAVWHTEELCFQNGKFDVDVAEAEFGLPLPPWERLHDTMILLFLDSPDEREIGLKPSAERLLDWAPEEQDAVVEWLVEHQPIPGLRLGRTKNSDRYAGAYLAFAPGELVGKYANGDTDRTDALFALLWPKIVSDGMGPAYDRERQLLPVLLAMERRGLAVDLPRLQRDVKTYQQAQTDVDRWLLKRLKAPADINLDSGEQLVKAMIKAGVADEDKLGVTKTGKPQSNKDALMGAVTDHSVLGVLRYRASLKTCLGTFMEPWLEMATRSGGRIFTTWNQVKAESGGDLAGTRTGRLSATWFMNMPKEFKAIFRHEEADAKAAKKLPVCPIRGLPSLPLCRGYITPFDGHVFCDRDYSQQEPRILAHFEGGPLMAAYQENPWLDLHDQAKDELEAFGLFYDRKPVKNTNLGLIYGMGVGKLALKNDMSVDEAKTLKNAILELYPGLKEMYADMRRRARANEPIRTWGGRVYYCEPPKVIDGRLVTFDYKMVNKLIQGSAADCTKEALLRLHKRIVELGLQERWFIVLLVHDQLVISVPKADLHKAMKICTEIMHSIEFDVLMLSEGEYTATNWADMKPYDEKGVTVYAGR